MAAEWTPAPQAPARAPAQSEGLRDGYSGLADDSAQSERRREAAMLFSVAEANLDAEDFEEAVVAGGDASRLFRELGDAAGVADALRVVAQAHRGAAEAAYARERDREAAEALRRAEELVRQEAEAFRAVGERRGEAAMLLALSEALYDSDDARKAQDALDAAEDALTIYGELGDARKEGAACMALARARFEAKQVAAAKRAGSDAVALFRGAGDRRLEAAAWGALALISGLDFCFDEAARCDRRRLKLACEVGDRRLQACAELQLARWSLSRGEAGAALARADAARGLLLELGGRRCDGLEVAAVGLVANAHVMRHDAQAAIDAVSQALERFRERGDRRHAAEVLYHLAVAQHEAGAHDEALAAADEALGISRDLGARRLEAKLLEAVAHVHAEQRSIEEAKKAAQEAVEVLRNPSPMDGRRVRAYCKAHIFCLAKILTMLEQFGDAVKACDEALRIARDSEDRVLEGHATLAVCAAQANNRNLEKALKAGELAAEIFQEVGPCCRVDEAKSWQILADIHVGMGDAAQALRALDRAESRLQGVGDRRRLASVKHVRCRMHMDLGEFQDAARVAAEALKISRSEDDMPGTAQSLLRLIEANVEILSGDSSEERSWRVHQQACEKSIRLAKEAVSISMKMGDKHTEAAAYCWASHLQIMISKLQEAKHAAQSAFELYGDVRDKSGQAHALSLVAQAEFIFGANAAALKAIGEAVALAGDGRDEAVRSFVAELQQSLSGRAAAPAAALAVAQEAAPRGDAAAAAASGGDAVDAFVAPDPTMVRSFILSLVQNMTGGAEGDIDGDTPLMDSGIDSLASVELRTQLQQEFRIDLPSTVMFNYPTISTMTNLLVDECTNKKIMWNR